MKEDRKEVICPFCGHPMGWSSYAMSEECGYDVEGKIVAFYTCTYCGTTGEFVENMDEDFNKEE